MNNLKPSGWNWSSFLFGPFWYLANGLIGKGLLLLLIALATFGFGIPIIWVYCGLRGNSDSYEKRLKEQAKIDVKNI